MRESKRGKERDTGAHNPADLIASASIFRSSGPDQEREEERERKKKKRERKR